MRRGKRSNQINQPCEMIFAAGHEGNLVQTMPGNSWSALLRLYGPLEGWFDKTWRPSEVPMTQAMFFSVDETTDIGHDSGTPVTPDYSVHASRFTGKIHWVQLDVGADDNDRFITPEERLRIAMARQ